MDSFMSDDPEMRDEEVMRLLDEYKYHSFLGEAIQLVKDGYPLSDEMKDTLRQYDINPNDLEKMIW